MSTRHLVLLSAGLSQTSSTSKLVREIGNSVEAAVTARGEALEMTFIDLRPMAVELAQALTTPGMSGPQLDAAKEALAHADGLVAGTPVFQASYSGLFKLFIDVLDQDALRGLPTLMAATAGSPRHALMLEHAMRPLFSYLRAHLVPTAIFSATEDYGTPEGLALPRRINRAAGQLADLMVAADHVGGLGGMTAQGATGPLPPRGEDKAAGLDFLPFDQILDGYDKPKP